MAIKIYFFFLCLFFNTCLLIAQQNDYASSKRYQQNSPTLLLQQARALKDSDPIQAIKLVESAINLIRSNEGNNTDRRKNEKQSKRQNYESTNENTAKESDAFVLLASIYEQIDQKELALERYRQALLLLDKKEKNGRAEILERLGYLNLALGFDAAAEQYYKDCINYSDDKELTLRCEEGLADVKLYVQDAAGVDAILESIESNYQLDSVDLAKNEARRAQNYAQQNDYDRAAASFQNSVNILPQNNKLSKEEAAPFEQAKEKILENKKVSSKDEIELRSSVNNKQNFSNEALVLENLKIASVYESEKNYLDAERFDVVAKDLIDVNTDADIAADVFKKSSEIQQRKGKIDLALNDLEKYIEAKEKAIHDLEAELKEQVEIVKGQQQIDLQQKDFDLEEKERELLASRLRTQQMITGLLCLILLASVIYFYFLYKNIREKRKANQLLLLKSLRTQMNPHFIFNALNSVNNFIAKNDEKAANKFLSDFSKLMRKVLDYSQKDFITMEEELELNQLYIKLEHFRFRDKFDYTFDNHIGHKYDHLSVPPMLIQPFIENAIWHGLRYKEEKGHLTISIQEQENCLLVKITDDGIGRKQSKALKTENQKKYKSTGIENVSRSMALINDIYGKKYEVRVRDQNDQSGLGTIVEIRMPKA